MGFNSALNGLRNEDTVMRCKSRAAVMNNLMTVYTNELVT